MSKDYSFLAGLINEDIYCIKAEPDNQSSTNELLNPQNPLTIAEDDETGPTDTIEPAQIHVAGQNLKEILVLIDEPDQKLLNPADEAFLEKVLMAVDVDLNDIALVNIAGMNQAQMKDVRMVPHGLRFCFMEKIPDALQEPGLMRYQNMLCEGRRILWCGTLGSISRNKELKIELWQELKLLFHK